MLAALVEKMGHKHEQMGDFSRKMEIMQDNQIKRLEIKNLVTKMRTAFDKLISKLNTVKKASVNLKISQ